MPALAVGADLIEVARIAEVIARHGERFLARVFTADERAVCGGRAESLAARWAAKEAVAKALGTGIGDVCWHDIEVLQDEKRRPTLRLTGRAASLADESGLHTWAISLAHDGGMALAFVVALS